MVKSCKELWSNTNFILKFGVIICGILTTGLGRYYMYNYITAAYEQSCLTIIFALLVTYIFFESTTITEVCLLVAALVKLIVATVYYAKHRFTLYGYYPDNDEPPETYKSELKIENNQVTSDSIVGVESRSIYSSGESDNIQFYLHLVINIIAIILIAVDIFLNGKK